MYKHICSNVQMYLSVSIHCSEDVSESLGGPLMSDHLSANSLLESHLRFTSFTSRRGRSGKLCENCLHLILPIALTLNIDLLIFPNIFLFCSFEVEWFPKIENSPSGWIGSVNVCGERFDSFMADWGQFDPLPP